MTQSCLALALAQGPGEVQQAQNWVESGKTDQAYALLEKMPRENPDFFSAWIELQKIHYSHAEWDRFFAYATFYRKNYLEGVPPAEQKANFRARLLALEILALGKQCQWDSAFAVAKEGLDLAQKIGSPADVQEIDQAFSLVQLQHSYPKVKNAKDGSTIPHSIFKSELHWPIQNKNITQLEHPRLLRLKIKNLCELEDKKKN